MLFATGSQLGKLAFPVLPPVAFGLGGARTRPRRHCPPMTDCRFNSQGVPSTYLVGDAVMKKIAFLSLILPLAACATQQQTAQEKADLLARAQAVCGGNTNIRCLNGVVARTSVNMIVARQGDGSLTLKYAR